MQDITLPLSKDQVYERVKQIASLHVTGALIIDPNDKNYPIIYCNDTFLTMTGYSIDQVIGQPLQFMNGKRTSAKAANKLQQLTLATSVTKLKLIQHKADQRAFWHELTCHPMRDCSNTVQYLLVYSDDITSSSLSRLISKLEIEVYDQLDIDSLEEDDSFIFQLITTKVEEHYLLDMYCTIHLLNNDSSPELVGHGSLPLRVTQQILTENPTIFSGSNQQQLTHMPIHTSELFCKQYLEHDKQFNIQYCWVNPILNKNNELKGYMTFYFEETLIPQETDVQFFNRILHLVLIAKKYKQQKQTLKQLAYYDYSINIPNAHYFRLKMDEWIKTGLEGIVILIQPSEYNKVVDLYGRKKGDDLLKQIHDRLMMHKSHHQEFIARFSNSLIIGSVIPHSELNTYDSRIRPLTLIPYFIDEKEIHITLKIGVGYFSGNSTVDDSIRQADIALSKARQNSGTSVAHFITEIDEELKLEMETLTEIRNGLANDEFTLHLQPKMNIKTGRIDGFEALSRWTSKKLGSVPPSIFIPVAEQAGLIKEIDEIVLNKSLSWLENRIKNGLPVVPIAINISPDHFYQENFLSNFKLILNQYDIPLHLIKLELTESIELVDFSRAKQILDELKIMGIECSIDDFGVGFSSLSYLPKLPFSEIKIDRSFVNAIKDPGMYAVIQTIIQLASNLQMKAVAEGIETLEQYIMLKNMGCHIGQGYYIHKPMTLDVASALLDSI